MPYYGTNIDKINMRDYRLPEGYLSTMALNECLHNHPERQTRGALRMLQTKLPFDEEQFWFCLTGLHKNIYFDVFGWEAEEYLELFDHIRLLTVHTLQKNGYQGDPFMVFGEDVKQMAVIFSPGEAPLCTPWELAAQINALGQMIYEEKVFKGDTRYCNVTALSDELHGFTGMREGYLQTRKLNDLSFFHMTPAVITTQWLEDHRNGADYRVVMGACRRLQQALDQGEAALCRKALDALFQTIKGSYSWTLLQDALSYCKHMLELRCTVRGLRGVDLETLCARESYLRIEEWAEALWPVLEELCGLTRQQGPYQELMLQAIYYIKLHYAQDLALTDVAAYAGVSPNYLSNTFQKDMGLTLREYITGQRLEEARHLLRETSLRVSDIAERVGIHDVKYFSRLFKKACTMTPGEYRRG